jgi:hypothetical protein
VRNPYIFSLVCRYSIIVKYHIIYAALLDKK